MAIHKVSSSAQLLSALSSASGGDAIVLAEANYGSVQITRDYGSLVTIRSATPLAATFDALEFSGASNVRVEGVHVDNLGNGAVNSTLVNIGNGSHHIEFVDSEVNGAVDENFSGWQGIYSDGSVSHLLIENNDVHDVYRSLMVFGSNNVKVLENRFDRVGEDAMKFGNVDQLLVENNISSGPYMSGSHIDFMQFQGNLSTNIVVRGNVLLPDARGNMQGVFFGVTTVHNVLVEDNFIHTGMGNGIFFREGTGIVVKYNTLINLNGQFTGISVPNGSVSMGNIYTVSYGAVGFLDENLALQSARPASPGYVTNYYVNGDLGLGLGLDDLGIVEGSPAESMGAADRLRELLGLPPTGAPTVSSATPTEGVALMAATGLIFDDDHIVTPFSLQWQMLNGGVWADIAGATNATFTPAQLQVGHEIRVAASYTDGGGTTETVHSSQTGIVGDLYVANAGVQTFNGTDGNDNAATGEGKDTLNGNGGADLMNGGANDDKLNGGAGNDTLIGDAGSDTLNGGTGADSMDGGNGNDTYNVDDPLDGVTDAAGTDLIKTSLNSFATPGSIENVTFDGTGAFSVTGNGLGNRLQGGAAADTLEGGGGVDILVGLAGDDIYFVDNAADAVTEAAGGGVDTIVSSVTKTLAANVERLDLTGRADIGATGNNGANTLVGNAGANSLSGGNGDDILSGGGGNDILIGGEGNDHFRFWSAGFGSDAITGFDADPSSGQDKIDLSGFGITAASFASDVAIAGSTTTVLTLLETDTITLVGINASSVSQTDFILG